MANHGSIKAAFFALGFGSAGGYALSLAASPVLTRLYTPEEFGVFGVFGAIVAITSIFATMSFELGILGARNRSAAFQYVSSSVLLALSVTVLYLPLALYIAAKFPSIGLQSAGISMAMVVCVVTVFQIVATNWAIQTNRAGLAARATFSGLAGRSIFQIGLGFSIGGIWGLITGELLGRVFGWLVAERGTLPRALAHIVGAPRKIISHIVSNRPYVTHLTPSIAIEVALVWLPAPGFALFYGPAIGGLVALVQRLGSAPLTIINQSLGQLVHRHAGTMLRADRMRVLRLIGILIITTLPLLALLMALLWWRGREVAAFVFGEQWHSAGTIALAFAPLYYVQFLSLITSRLILVMNLLRLKLVGSILHLAVLCLSFPLARESGLDWVGAITLQAGLLTLSHVIVLFMVLRGVTQYAAR